MFFAATKFFNLYLKIYNIKLCSYILLLYISTTVIVIFRHPFFIILLRKNVKNVDENSVSFFLKFRGTVHIALGNMQKENAGAKMYIRMRIGFN